MTTEIPNYSDYELIELYQVLNTIRGDEYPEVQAALDAEIASRQPDSVFELRDCFFALDRKQHPEVAIRILEQIDALGGMPEDLSGLVNDDNRYLTFWRRFWAEVWDSLLVLLPSATIGAIVAGVMDDAALMNGVTVLAFIVFRLGYVVTAQAISGQTLGKMLIRLKVVRYPELEPIAFGRAIRRSALLLLALVVVILHFVVTGEFWPAGEEPPELTPLFTLILLLIFVADLGFAAIDKKSRALHDQIAGTAVIRVPRPQKTRRKTTRAAAKD